MKTDKLSKYLTVTAQITGVLRDLSIVILIMALLTGSVPLQTALMTRKVDNCMGVTFNQTVDQSLDFAPIVGGATLRNIRIILRQDTPTDQSELLDLRDGTGTATEATGVWINTFNDLFDLGKFEFYVNWSGANGVWRTTNDVLSANAINEIVITYDGSSASNTPVFYVNGVSVAVGLRQAPTGSLDVSATIIPIIGSTNTFHFKSPMGSVLVAQYITGRIISAAEVLEAYNSRLAIPSYRGLVFAPLLCGAAGVQNFNGAALGAANTLRDLINGATGAPNGSPIGVMDTYLTFQGVN